MEQLNAFIEKAKSEKELADKLSELDPKGAKAEEYVALAAEYGFTITAEEIEKHRKRAELSEEELEGVVGGEAAFQTSLTCWFTPTGKGYKKSMFSDYRVECKSFCFGIIEQCSCYGGGRGGEICYEKWHVIEKKEGAPDRPRDHYLAPIDKSNHWKKAPFTYEA